MLTKLLSTDGRAVLEAIMRHVPTGLTLAVAPDGTILRVSDYANRLLGKPRSMLEGISVEQQVETYGVLDPKTGEPAKTADLPITRAITQGEVVQNEEWLVTDHAGNHIPVLCNAGPIRGENGAIVGAAIAWSDMREQKDVQTDLEALIEQRGSLIRDVNQRAKTDFETVAAIIRSEASRRGPAFSDFAQEIEHLLHVFSASYDGACQTPDFGTVDACDHLRRVCNGLSCGPHPVVIMAEAGLRFTSDQAAPVGLILNEAVRNALKHAFSDGRAGRIDICVKRGGDKIVMTVADDGIGPPSVAPASDAGLAFSRRLAGQLGGECSLRKGDRQGAVFTLAIPMAPKNHPPD